MRITLRVIILLALAVGVVSSAGPAGAEGSAKERIEEAYRGISDIRGEFFQKSIIRELDETQTGEGVFYIRRPDRVRWDYVKPSRQTAIIIGDRMMVRQEDDPEILQGRFDSDAYGQTPLALLSDLSRMEDDFEVRPQGDGVLILLPRKKMGMVKTVRVETVDAPFPIRIIHITDTVGNDNIFELKKVRLNTGMDDSLFIP